MAAKLRERQIRDTHESEERFHSLFELALEGIVIHDRHGILAVNPAFTRLFQTSADDALGRPLADFVIDESMSLSVADMMNSDHVQSRHEVTGRRSDGTSFGLNRAF